MDLVHKGSVKNIYRAAANELLFCYSDRFSVFDWGAMPTELENKGKALSAMAHFFFQELEKPSRWQEFKFSTTSEKSKILASLRNLGLKHHCLSQWGQDHACRVREMAIHKPRFQLGTYDYSIYLTKPQMSLVPLEVVFRYVISKESSLLKRAKDTDYLESLGIESVIPGQVFDKPLIEYSTKLESTDRYLTYNQAQQLGGLSSHEVDELRELTSLTAEFLKQLFSGIGIDLQDGKLEWGFGEGHDKREFLLVDSIGPDELRLDYQGVQLSKECLRKYYRQTSWFEATEKAKAIAEKRKESDWRRICLNELKESPPELPQDLKEVVEMLYMSLAEALFSFYQQKTVFPKAWSLNQLVQRLKAIQ